MSHAGDFGPRLLTDIELAAYQRRIEALALEARRRCAGSHDFYVDLFSDTVDEAFDPDDSLFWVAMMSFLRQRDYATPEERRLADEQRDENGYCSHGLTFWTCPAGCFEG